MATDSNTTPTPEEPAKAPRTRKPKAEQAAPAEVKHGTIREGKDGTEAFCKDHGEWHPVTAEFYYADTQHKTSDTGFYVTGRCKPLAKEYRAKLRETTAKGDRQPRARKAKREITDEAKRAEYEKLAEAATKAAEERDRFFEEHAVEVTPEQKQSAAMKIAELESRIAELTSAEVTAER